jgi:hypothetical protein
MSSRALCYVLVFKHESYYYVYSYIVLLVKLVTLMDNHDCLKILIKYSDLKVFV